MKKIISVVLISVIGFSSFLEYVISQEESYEEFLNWCEPQFGEKCSEIYQERQIPSKTEYNVVFVLLLIIIGLAITGNYFWSKRKGRSYSEE